MQTAIRDAVVGYLRPLFTSSYPALTIFFDNEAFDWNNAPETFVEVEIQFYDGQQVSLSSSPKRRLIGRIYTTVYARAGIGTREALQISDWLQNTLMFRTIGIITTEAPIPDGAAPGGGYYRVEASVPFISDPA